MHCIQELGQAVRLRSEKRLRIREEVYSEANMLDDSVKGADNFLSRWRKARQLLFRENQVGPDSQQMVNTLASQGVDAASLNACQAAYELTERRELDYFLMRRVQPTVDKHLMQLRSKPTTLDACIQCIEEWIESCSRDKA